MVGALIRPERSTVPVINGLFAEDLLRRSVTSTLSRNVNELQMWITEAMGDRMHNTDGHDEVPVLN